MLKIKDNVDLKELEKFGFKKLNDSDMQPYGFELNVEDSAYSNWSDNGFAMLEVDGFDFNGKKDRILHLYTTTNDEVWWDIDVIFDLISAGLVEKVVEDD